VCLCVCLCLCVCVCVCLCLCNWSRSPNTSERARDQDTLILSRHEGGEKRGRRGKDGIPFSISTTTANYHPFICIIGGEERGRRRKSGILFLSLVCHYLVLFFCLYIRRKGGRQKRQLLQQKGQGMRPLPRRFRV
jgi:hypothetical protein